VEVEWPPEVTKTSLGP